MIVQVYHREEGKLVHVASVSAEPVKGDPEAVLDFAWERTQNIEGSWSRPQYIGERFNPDFHQSVIRQAPLPEHNGRVYGLRSSQVGDVLVLENGVAYEVAGVGFKVFDGEVPA
jgi:hypothetical protein